VLSALLIGTLTAVVLGRAGLLGWAPTAWAAWGTLAFSALAVLANAVTPSAAERRIWLPITVLMLGSAALVVLS
jgi:hypothetical protein